MNKKIDPEAKCMICGACAEVKYLMHPGYQRPHVFNIYHCNKCNSAFSSPRCNVDFIYESIYRNGPSVPGYNRYWDYAERVKNEESPFEYLADVEDCYWSIKEALQAVVEERNKADVNILEIGCGLGYLTYSIHKNGYRILGMDIAEHSIKSAIEDFGNLFLHADLYKYAPNHQQEYDVIILTEVIEHIDDIIKFMAAIKLLLKQSGHIILTTPNKSFYPSNIIWATDLPPVHCWWLSEESLGYIASSLAMSISFIDFTAYYSKHPTSSDMKILEYMPITPVVLDENGDLLWRIGNNENWHQRIKISVGIFGSSAESVGA